MMLAMAEPVSRLPPWKPTLLGRIYAPLAAFLGGRRLWIIAALLGVCGAALKLAFVTADDYWTPIVLEVSVACGLLAALQLFLGTKVTFTERLFAAASALVLLLLAWRTSGLWRNVLIEAGCGVALFLVLDLYLERRLEKLEQHEGARARLNLIALELYQFVSSWTGEARGREGIKSEGGIPPGPEPLHVGSEPIRRVVEHDPVRWRKEQEAMSQTIRSADAVRLFRSERTVPLVRAVNPPRLITVTSLPEVWRQALDHGFMDRDLATQIAETVERFILSATRSHKLEEVENMTRLRKDIQAYLDGLAPRSGPLHLDV